MSFRGHRDRRSQIMSEIKDKLNKHESSRVSKQHERLFESGSSGRYEEASSSIYEKSSTGQRESMPITVDVSGVREEGRSSSGRGDGYDEEVSKGVHGQGEESSATPDQSWNGSGQTWGDVHGVGNVFGSRSGDVFGDEVGEQDEGLEDEVDEGEVGEGNPYDDDAGDDNRGGDMDDFGFRGDAHGGERTMSVIDEYDDGSTARTPDVTGDNRGDGYNSPGGSTVTFDDQAGTGTRYDDHNNFPLNDGDGPKDQPGSASQFDKQFTPNGSPPHGWAAETPKSNQSNVEEENNSTTDVDGMPMEQLDRDPQSYRQAVPSPVSQCESPASNPRSNQSNDEDDDNSATDGAPTPDEQLASRMVGSNQSIHEEVDDAPRTPENEPTSASSAEETMEITVSSRHSSLRSGLDGAVFEDLAQRSSNGSKPFSGTRNVPRSSNSLDDAEQAEPTPGSNTVPLEEMWVRGREEFESVDSDVVRPASRASNSIFGGSSSGAENSRSGGRSSPSSRDRKQTSQCTPNGFPGDQHSHRPKDVLARLWKSSTFTDITLISGAYSFPVHKCILAAQSSYFRDACRYNILSSPKGDILNMHADDPVALRSILQYFYTGKLSVPLNNLLILGGPEIPSIDILIKVYRLSFKYSLPDLRKQAMEKYCAALSDTWPRGHGVLLAKALTETFKQDLREPEALREATLKVAVTFREELLDDKTVYDLLSAEALRALVLRLSRRGGISAGSSRPASALVDKFATAPSPGRSSARTAVSSRLGSRLSGSIQSPAQLWR